jgi:hypothetical protein
MIFTVAMITKAATTRTMGMTYAKGENMAMLLKAAEARLHPEAAAKLPGRPIHVRDRGPIALPIRGED